MMPQESGAGLDAVSGGEVYRAVQAGASPHQIVFAGVGKTEAELRYAIQLGVGWLNVESGQEIVRQQLPDTPPLVGCLFQITKCFEQIREIFVKVMVAGSVLNSFSKKFTRFLCGSNVQLRMKFLFLVLKAFQAPGVVELLAERSLLQSANDRLQHKGTVPITQS